MGQTKWGRRDVNVRGKVDIEFIIALAGGEDRGRGEGGVVE